MNTQHTPGPWKYNDDTQSIISASNWLIIAKIASGEGACLSNARLIAAAPDLLAALEALLQEANCYAVESRPKLNRLCDAARAAIAKARPQ